ncbi:MAG: hypothetical protein DVB23_001175 [Verrucomicrobia bacterium]|nr:MAG: hypothetical protein DVB23_001175 [Verrucomicrobiota bacterium]
MFDEKIVNCRDEGRANFAPAMRRTQADAHLFVEGLPSVLLAAVFGAAIRLQVDISESAQCHR